MNQLAEYYDPAFELETSIDMLWLSRFHAARLSCLADWGTRYAQMKRRLGQDATPGELARDKRVSRSVRWRCMQMSKFWLPDSAVEGFDGLDKKLLAFENLLWGTVATRQLKVIEQAKIEVATVALRSDQKHWGGVRMVLLHQEQRLWTEVADRMPIS